MSHAGPARKSVKPMNVTVHPTHGHINFSRVASFFGVFSSTRIVVASLLEEGHHASRIGSRLTHDPPGRAHTAPHRKTGLPGTVIQSLA